MRLLLEVLTEFVSMFWADAGLCLGSLGVVASVGVLRHGGWLGDAESALALSLGCVMVLWLSVWRAHRRSVRAASTSRTASL
jgi:hypothetical protein